MPKAATKTIIASSCSQQYQYQNADRAELLSYGRATGRFNDDNAPWTFKFELSGDGKSTTVELHNDAAIAMAMIIVGFAAGDFGGSRLKSEEMSFLKYVVASKVIDDRQRQLVERYNAGEVSQQEFKRLVQEARQGPCWPTENFDELKAALPLLDLAKLRQGGGDAERAAR
ncbi:hypothetical protein ACE102_03090 [Bradyrhizobium sp. vgs-9]|uniref:hypothetical protein n=1 Tax=Bradyrhizobium sp. vgs-9 TaxID=208389 RepID=UPI0035D492D7